MKKAVPFFTAIAIAAVVGAASVAHAATPTPTPSPTTGPTAAATSAPAKPVTTTISANSAIAAQPAIGAATLLKDINVVGNGVVTLAHAVVGGYLVFPANDGLHGLELWRTNGTTAGTVLVKDINANGGASALPDPETFGTLGGFVYFSADDGIHGLELWRSNGTAAGTTLVKDLEPISGSSNPHGFATVGSTLYFIADTVATGTELWKTDGTAAGTQQVADIWAADGSGVQDESLVAFNGAVYFAGTNGVDGLEPWTSQGTVLSTHQLANIGAGAANSSPTNFTVFRNELYFAATASGTGRELWGTNGTTTGLVSDINPAGDSSPTELVSTGKYLYFSADDGTHGAEVWRADGTFSGTQLVADAMPGSLSSAPWHLTVVGDTVYFNATGPSIGQELYKASSTTVGTTLVKDVNVAYPGNIGSSPEYPLAAGSKLYFRANDGVHGAELWVTAGTAATTKIVVDLVPGDKNSDSYVEPMVFFKGRVYFIALAGKYGGELWSVKG
jgi:ELWxxDGT repeat protein